MSNVLQVKEESICVACYVNGDYWKNIYVPIHLLKISFNVEGNIISANIDKYHVKNRTHYKTNLQSNKVVLDNDKLVLVK